MLRRAVLLVALASCVVLTACEVLSVEPFLDPSRAVRKKAFVTDLYSGDPAKPTSRVRIRAHGDGYRATFTEYQHGKRQEEVQAEVAFFELGEKLVAQYRFIPARKQTPEARDLMWRLVRLDVQNGKIVGMFLPDDNEFEVRWSAFASTRPECGRAMRASARGWCGGDLLVSANQTCMHVFLAQAPDSIWFIGKN